MKNFQILFLFTLFVISFLLVQDQILSENIRIFLKIDESQRDHPKLDHDDRIKKKAVLVRENTHKIFYNFKRFLHSCVPAPHFLVSFSIIITTRFTSSSLFTPSLNPVFLRQQFLKLIKFNHAFAYWHS